MHEKILSKSKLSKARIPPSVAFEPDKAKGPDTNQPIYGDNSLSSRSWIL